MNNLWQSQARWIWLPTAGGLNRYGDFRRTFTLPEAPGQVRLYISADSRYAVSVNGRPVPASQYADYAHDKVYDTVDITAWVHPGQNVLAVLGIRPDGRREEPLPCGLYEVRLSEEGPDPLSQASPYNSPIPS